MKYIRCETEKLLDISEIRKKNNDGNYIAITESGRKYNATYISKYRVMFFAIPSSETILGYIPVK